MKQRDMSEKRKPCHVMADNMVYGPLKCEETIDLQGHMLKQHLIPHHHGDITVVKVVTSVTVAG